MRDGHARQALRIGVQARFAFFDDLGAAVQGSIDQLVGLL